MPLRLPIDESSLAFQMLKTHSCHCTSPSVKHQVAKPIFTDDKSSATLPTEQRSASCCKCHVVGNHQYLNTLFECTSRIFFDLPSCQTTFIIRNK